MFGSPKQQMNQALDSLEEQLRGVDITVGGETAVRSEFYDALMDRGVNTRYITHVLEHAEVSFQIYGDDYLEVEEEVRRFAGLIADTCVRMIDSIQSRGWTVDKEDAVIFGCLKGMSMEF